MIGVVLNPHALGVRQTRGLAERLRSILDGRGVVMETRSTLEVDRVVERFIGLGADPVGICGGDGTNLSTLTGYVKRVGEGGLPRFALLRGGTVNTVAKNVGVRGSPEAVLARLVEDARRGALPERPLDTIEVNGRVGFLFAAAMGARFLEAYYRGPLQGAPWATLMALRTVASSLGGGSWARWLFEPIPVELDADGERQPIERARLLVVSSVPDVGLGFRVAWRAGREPRRFQLLASGISTTRMALQMDKVLTGRPLSGRPHVDRLAGSVRIRFQSPQSYTFDGELFREQDIEVRAGPRLRVVTS